MPALRASYSTAQADEAVLTRAHRASRTALEAERGCQIEARSRYSDPVELIIVGSEYYGDYFAKHRRDRVVTLWREPQNKYDKNAIAVVAKGKLVGYISASKAARVRGAVEYFGGRIDVPLLYRGANVFAIVPDDWDRPASSPGKASTRRKG